MELARLHVWPPLLIAIWALLAPGIYGPAFAHEFSGTVTRVHDGDTLTLDDGTKIRLFGIDAPELSQKCLQNDACVPCGVVSRDTLTKLVSGTLINCTTRGRSYDRFVGQCYLGGKDISLHMVELGQAIVYYRYLREDDTEFGKAEQSARSSELGIWLSTFVTPADWRRHRQRLTCEQ